MGKKKPSFFWVVFSYLVPILVLVALGTLVLVILSEEPSQGTQCKMLGEVVVRKQDEVKLQCVKNVSTGKLFWVKLER